MADAKISALTNYTTPIATDVLPIVDVTNGITKKIPFSIINGFIGTTTWMQAGVQTSDGIVTITIGDSGGYSSSLVVTDTTTGIDLLNWNRGNSQDVPVFSFSFPVKKGNTVTVNIGGGGYINKAIIYKFN